MQVRDEFSGEKRHVQRCISDPLNPVRVLPVDDDLLFALEGCELGAHTELIAYFEKQVTAIEKMVGPGASQSATVDLRSAMEQLASTYPALESQASKLRKGVDARVLAPMDKTAEMGSYARELARTGRQMGRVVDPVTDKEMALLIGCSMYDEATKHDVLVLAVQEDEDTGYSEGLGCTVVDPVSGSVVSATIGGRMRDAGSGETVPITGVYREPTTYQVIATSSLRGKGGGGLGGALAVRCVGYERFEEKNGGGDLLAALSGGGSGGGRTPSSVGFFGDRAGGASPTGGPRPAMMKRQMTMAIVPTLAGMKPQDNQAKADSPAARLEALLEQARNEEGVDDEVLDAISRIRHDVQTDGIRLKEEMEKAEAALDDDHEQRVKSVEADPEINAAQRKKLIEAKP
ncbi:hypothetical protein T484DRAFT_1813261 [Baffinella frigidus]|nr:hypothetical protein T484DRAFT_1813261 [Cryptophyta sp. CCMP2293]